AETGEVENTANLAKTISYTSRPIIADGLIVVPLDGGALQALTADTLTTKWITSEVSDYSQSSCTLTVHNGTVLVGTTDFSTGCIRAFDLETGKLLWSYDNSDECYYWNGGVVVNDTFVMSTQTATFEAINVKTGTVIGSVLSLKELGIDTKINSDLVVDDEGRIYAITRDGVVRILELTTQGLQQTDTIDLGITDIVCTPTILDRTMIVGCPNGLALINLDTKALTRITSLDNGEAIGDVRSTPLVSCQDDKTVVYFTQNKYDGSLYQYVLGESSATCIWEATDSYVQYCDSPIATDKKGNLYYVIDYSYLVAFAAGKTSNSSDESGSDDGPNNGSNSSGNEEGSNNSDNSSGNSSASASKGAPLSEQGAQMGTAEVSTAELSSDENMEGSTESVSNYSLKKAEGQSEEGSLSSDMLPFVGIAGGVVLLGVAAWLLVGKRPGRFN
ncbi:MAG: PQQ-binding-like beta-propeller repeat protein, partial [Anaerotardibacter sp.]